MRKELCQKGTKSNICFGFVTFNQPCSEVLIIASAQILTTTTQKLHKRLPWIQCCHETTPEFISQLEFIVKKVQVI